MSMVCSRCNETNTEFSQFDVEVDVSELKNRVTFKLNTWARRVFHRYIMTLLDNKVTKTVHICQTCQSRMFRKLDSKK